MRVFFDQSQCLAHRLGALLNAVLVEGVAVQQVLAQGLRGPLENLRAFSGVGLVARRKNGIEIVVLDLALNLASTLRLNYQEALAARSKTAPCCEHAGFGQISALISLNR